MPRNYSINELKMLHEDNEQHLAQIELYNKLAEAQREVKVGVKLVSLDEVFAKYEGI